MTNPNIPPEIADDLLDRAEGVVTSAEWLPESVVCILGAMCDLRSSVQRAIAASNEIADATPAPAPVRISPEVRETILRALGESVATQANQPFTEWLDQFNRARTAAAFVEALP